MKIKNEIAYQITMNYLKYMLEKKIISIEEYNQVMVEFKKKYTPKVSSLFFEIAQYHLIYTSFRVIYSNGKNGGA